MVSLFVQLNHIGTIVKDSTGFQTCTRVPEDDLTEKTLTLFDHCIRRNMTNYILKRFIQLKSGHND